MLRQGVDIMHRIFSQGLAGCRKVSEQPTKGLLMVDLNEEAQD